MWDGDAVWWEQKVTNDDWFEEYAKRCRFEREETQNQQFRTNYVSEFGFFLFFLLKILGSKAELEKFNKDNTQRINYELQTLEEVIIFFINHHINYIFS